MEGSSKNRGKENQGSSTRGIGKTAVLAALLFLAALPTEAQESLFKAFTAFRVIETEHFDIIFPRESEPSARLLASFADRIYQQVRSLLGIEVPVRIPVALTPHTDLFNGYFFRSPAPHIILYDTPQDLEWTSFANNLESLFLHELTHAVSLSTRGPFFRGLRQVFGNWVYPAWINAPPFMVEGVTVSFESLSGFGRANDPLVKQKLRQALYEGEFLTPFQASDVYDLPGQESMYYEYGGLFSAWLQKTYGMEKYAELWQALGRSFYFSFFVYRSGYYHFFKKVYGVDFTDAWKAFGDSLRLAGIEEHPGEILPKKYRFFSERETFYQGLRARGNTLYFLDKPEGKIAAYDTETGKIRRFDAAFSYDLDVSPDGAAVLASGYRYRGDRAFAIVTEYETASGRKTGRAFEGLYKARYFRDGVIGIDSEFHNNRVVYEPFDGGREILFRGSEDFLFSGPQAVDNRRVAFIAAREGVRELWLYDYVSRELFRIEGPPEDQGFWRYARGLGVSEGKLFFSHNADDGMYKLACLDLETLVGIFSSRDFSGGVFDPVSVNRTIYYRGAFFSRDRLSRFPEAASSLSGKRIKLKLVPLDPQSFDLLDEIPPSSGTGLPGNGAPEPLYPGTAKPYFAPRYLNPFQCWLPLPLIRSGDFNISLEGGGLFSVMEDPVNRNMITLEAYADIPYQMALIDRLVWQNTALGFPLTAAFSDKVIESGNDPYRSTAASLGGGPRWTAGRWLWDISLKAGYSRLADYEPGKSAYLWEEREGSFFISGGVTLSSLRRRAHEVFGTGLVMNLFGVSFLDRFEPRGEGRFRASVETRFPLCLTLFAVYDAGGMDIHGVSNSYGGPLVSLPALREYPHPRGLDTAWLGGAELAVGLFSLEIQKNLSHVYFNRVFGVLAVRNAVYDGSGQAQAPGTALGNPHLLQSLALKLGAGITFFPIIKTPVVFEPYIMGAWKLSGTLAREGSPWYLTAGFTLSY